MSTLTRATLLIALTSICFGMVPLFGRVLLDTGLSPQSIALYRFCLALPLALVFLPRRRDALRPVFALTGAGLAGGLGWTAYLNALDHVTVAAAGVVYMSYPLFVVLLARLLTGHAITLRAGLGAGLVLAGALTVHGATGGHGIDSGALLSILPAPLGFALIVVLLASVGGRLTTLERWSAICLGHVVGLLPAALISDAGALLPDAPRDWLWIAGIATVTATLPQLLYTGAARLISPARAAAAGSVELPTMLAVGWIAFGEPLGAAESLGALMVVAAVIVTPPVAPASRDRRDIGERANAVQPCPATIASRHSKTTLPTE